MIYYKQHYFWQFSQMRAVCVKLGRESLPPYFSQYNSRLHLTFTQLTKIKVGNLEKLL